MNGFHSKKAPPDQSIYDEPKVSKNRNEYVDLRPSSVQYRRYDELSGQLDYKNIQNTPIYTDILPESENYRKFGHFSSKRLDLTLGKSVSGYKLVKILIVTILITCIVSIGVAVLVFHFVNNEKDTSIACDTLNCGPVQSCYVNSEGQAVCVSPEGRTGIPDTSASFYIPEIQPECPDGWLTHRNSCYKEYGMRRTWFQSRDYCRSIGGDLVSILDDEEANFLDIHLNEKYMHWIGLSNFKLGYNFTWSDGSQSSYSNWKPGEPNNFNNNEQCGQLFKNDFPRQWNDNNCFMSLRFVCKKEKMPRCGFDSWYYHDNACYIFEIDFKENRENARIACRNISADLISINSKAENDFIVSRVTKSSYRNFWIGLSERQNGDYIWEDGSKPTVLYWGNTVPDESGPNCVRIFSEYGIWEYDLCNNINGYICEKKINPNK